MVDAMQDEEIDRSELPPLGEKFFARAKWRHPQQPPISITLRLDPDLYAWFQTQGQDFEKRMIAALRIYAQAHQEIAKAA